MNTRAKIFIPIVALALLGMFFYAYKNKPDILSAPEQSKKEELKLIKENDAISIDVTYPTVDERFLGAKEANLFIKENLDIRIAAFEKSATESLEAPIDLPKNIKSEARGSPSVEHETDRYVSIFFSAEWYLRGAAHPYHTIHTYIFDKKLQKLVTVQDLFMPYSKYFEFLSEYAYNDLIRQSEEGDLGFVYDKEMLRSGTEATLENFRHALPTKDGLMIYFDEYQVAPYAAGPQQVAIPYEFLREYVNPEGVLGVYIK
jgi:hypothetical protein